MAGTMTATAERAFRTRCPPRALGGRRSRRNNQFGEAPGLRAHSNAGDEARAHRNTRRMALRLAGVVTMSTKLPSDREDKAASVRRSTHQGRPPRTAARALAAVRAPETLLGASLTDTHDL